MEGILVDDVRTDLQALRPELFVTKWFVERTPWIFGCDQVLHVRFKHEIAERVGVSVYDVLIVGSAAVGLSLDPYKNFSPFRSDSDVDLAIVSPHFFDQAWRWMRDLGSERYRLPAYAQDWIKQHESRLVYWGQIATDQLLPHMPFGGSWTPHLEAASKGAPIDGRDVNVRLYRDHQSLESALRFTTRRLREKLERESGHE